MFFNQTIHFDQPGFFRIIHGIPESVSRKKMFGKNISRVRYPRILLEGGSSQETTLRVGPPLSSILRRLLEGSVPPSKLPTHLAATPVLSLLRSPAYFSCGPSEKLKGTLNAITWLLHKRRLGAALRRQMVAMVFSVECL